MDKNRIPTNSPAEIRIPNANDFRGAIDKALEPVRGYIRKQETAENKPEKSRFKCKIYFSDGNAKVFYSYDLVKNKDGKYQTDEWSGLMKLLRMVDRFEGTFKSAMIWATINHVPFTATSRYDITCVKVSKVHNYRNALISFGNDNTLDIQRFIRRQELKG